VSQAEPDEGQPQKRAEAEHVVEVDHDPQGLRGRDRVLDARFLQQPGCALEPDQRQGVSRG
jgi:hypothetical protein